MQNGTFLIGFFVFFLPLLGSHLSHVPVYHPIKYPNKLIFYQSHVTPTYLGFLFPIQELEEVTFITQLAGLTDHIPVGLRLKVIMDSEFEDE